MTTKMATLPPCPFNQKRLPVQHHHQPQDAIIIYHLQRVHSAGTLDLRASSAFRRPRKWAESLGPPASDIVIYWPPRTTRPKRHFTESRVRTWPRTPHQTRRAYAVFYAPSRLYHHVPSCGHCELVVNGGVSAFQSPAASRLCVADNLYGTS